MNFHNAFNVKWMRPTLFVGLLACAGANAARGAVIYDSYGFESPTFNTGALNAQGGWTVTSPALNNVSIQTDVAHEGNQAVQESGDTSDTTAKLSLSNALTENHYVDFWFLMNAKFQSKFNIRDENSKQRISLVIGATGSLSVGGSALNGAIAKGEWDRLTLYIRPAAALFDLYVNGTLTDSNLAMTTTNGNNTTKSYEFLQTGRLAPNLNAGSFYVDNFQITDTNPIPEPAMMGLLATGGLLLMRRRK